MDDVWAHVVLESHPALVLADGPPCCRLLARPSMSPAGPGEPCPPSPEPTHVPTPVPSSKKGKTTSPVPVDSLTLRPADGHDGVITSVTFGDDGVTVTCGDHEVSFENVEAAASAVTSHAMSVHDQHDLVAGMNPVLQGMMPSLKVCRKGRGIMAWDLPVSPA